MRLKGHPLIIAIIAIAALSVFVFLGKEDFKLCYDLMQHGKFTAGTVKAVTKKQDYRRRKYSSNTYTYYANTIEYAGTSGDFRSDKPMMIGQRVEIYYSSAAPGNARLREKGQPFKSVVDIMLAPDMLGWEAFGGLSFLLAIFGLFQWLTKSGRYYEGYS